MELLLGHVQYMHITYTFLWLIDEAKYSWKYTLLTTTHCTSNIMKL